MLLSTTNWHLPRALPTTEQQRHLPAASTETEPHAAIAVDLQQPLRDVRGVRHSGYPFCKCSEADEGHKGKVTKQVGKAPEKLSLSKQVGKDPEKLSLSVS